MAQPMVRISEQAHRALRELAQAEHQSMQAVLERAVEEYRRMRFLDEVNAAYAALRSDPEAWEEIQAERAAWEGMSEVEKEVPPSLSPPPPAPPMPAETSPTSAEP